MSSTELVEAVSALSPDEQNSVLEFIAFLRRRDTLRSPFLRAAEQFIAEDPEILQNLSR
jgi:hypothetical protein